MLQIYYTKQSNALYIVYTDLLIININFFESLIKEINRNINQFDWLIGLV